jgi:hypothetical protein
MEIHTHKLELDDSLPNDNAEVPAIFYRASSELTGKENWAWIDNGRIKIGNEILAYEKGIPPGNRITAITPANGPTIPADSRTIIGSGFLNGRYVRIENTQREVVKMGTLLGGFRTSVDSEDNAGIILRASNLLAHTPATGEFLYAKITKGTKVEWITYAGTSDAGGGKQRLTGVTRKVAGVEIANISGAELLIPSQYSGCERGQLGTQAGPIQPNTRIVAVGVLTTIKRAQAQTQSQLHNAGDKFGVFVNPDDAIRETAAHEAAHTVKVIHHRAQTIMQSDMKRGAYLGHGIYNDYNDDTRKEFNAR